MPELPEVETTLNGIRPHIKSQKINKIVIRQHNLRWPVPDNLTDILTGQTLQMAERRGKYILFHFKKGTLILHLGMSGSLRILTSDIPAQKHDHIDITFANKKILRLRDPRRFGACLWTDEDPAMHLLIKNLGPEPLNQNFNGNYLYDLSRRRNIAIKSFIMNSKIVVGVGNIYAAEALFASGIHPNTPAKNISVQKFDELTKQIKKILQKSITKGGTTLKDFVDSEGKPGYFSQQLKVYGREGLPCVHCKTPLQGLRLGQRSTVFCKKCQK